MENNKAIERIMKLLALADKDSGATEAEADTAMAKAQEIMKENNLSMAIVEAASGKVEGRSKEDTSKKAMYAYQRNLMSALCEVNYCHVKVKYKQAKDKQAIKEGYYKEYNDDPDYVPTIGRTVPCGYTIIGRESNVISVRIMFDYLLKTINRLVSEEADHNMSRWAMSWREGCAERLIVRLKHRHFEMLRKQKAEAEAKRREYETRTKHPGAAPEPGTALIVILEDYAQNEHDLNDDFRYGYPPGTTAKRRAESESARKKRRADAEAAGVTDKEVLDWIELGYTREQAEKIVHPDPKPEEKKKPETEAQRRKREEREAREDERYWRRQQRQERKRNWEGYEAGRKAGEKIGLDPQIDKPGARLK